MIFRQRILHGGMLALALTPHVPAAVSAAPPVTLTHVHGLAYSADGKQLMIPSHNGLAVYAEGRWSKAAQSPHPRSTSPLCASAVAQAIISRVSSRWCGARLKAGSTSPGRSAVVAAA